MKFIPKCSLSVGFNPIKNPDPSALVPQVESGYVTFDPNLTVEFEINRANLGASQDATFKVYNVGKKNRDLIYKDPYAATQYLNLQFRAGYEDQPVLPLCFNGFLLSATSYRTGVDFITEIKAYDGGLSMANGFSVGTIASGQTVGQLLLKLVSDLPGTVSTPLIGSFPTIYPRDRAYAGNTWSIILEESGNLACIDNGQVKILNPNEVVNATIPVINSATGLLGSPRRTPTGLEFDMIFEPRLTLAQIVQLESVDNPQWNGAYKVTSIHHRGTISPAVAGDNVTTVGLFYNFNPLIPVGGPVVQ